MSSLSTWIKDKYQGNPLFKLCVNAILGGLMIEFTLVCLKLIFALASWSAAWLPATSPSSSQLQLPVSKEELVRFIDDIAFVAMFAVYLLFEFLIFLIEMVKRLGVAVQKGQAPVP